MAPRARKLAKSVHSDAQRAFCDAMIAARKKAGPTQYQLAEKLKRPQSFVAKYEGASTLSNIRGHYRCSDQRSKELY
jgi:ribosome-binding protein aMBF1 (putative translation factor)